MDWSFFKLNALGVEAPLALGPLTKHVIDGSNPDLYQAGPIRARINTIAKKRVFKVAVGVVPGPDEQHRASPLRNMLSFLVRHAAIYCPFSFVISPFSSRLDPPDPDVGRLLAVFVPIYSPDPSRSGTLSMLL